MEILNPGTKDERLQFGDMALLIDSQGWTVRDAEGYCEPLTVGEAIAMARLASGSDAEAGVVRQYITERSEKAEPFYPLIRQQLRDIR